MKHPKSRFTANQFDQALLEQVEHSRGLNISANAIASAMTFCDLTIARLCGPRQMSKRSAEFQAMFERTINAAREEREEFYCRQQEIERAERDRRQREKSGIVTPHGGGKIIIPGGRN